MQAPGMDELLLQRRDLGGAADRGQGLGRRVWGTVSSGVQGLSSGFPSLRGVGLQVESL